MLMPLAQEDLLVFPCLRFNNREDWARLCHSAGHVIHTAAAVFITFWPEMAFRFSSFIPTPLTDTVEASKHHPWFLLRPANCTEREENTFFTFQVPKPRGRGASWNKPAIRTMDSRLTFAAGVAP